MDFSMLSSVAALLKGGGDPSAMLGMLGGSNPALKQAMDIAKGKDPKALENYVRAEFDKRGMNINEALKALGIN